MTMHTKVLLFLMGLGLVLAQTQNETHCANTVNGITMTLSKIHTFPTETCLRLTAALRQVIENRVSSHLQTLVASRQRFGVPDETHNVSCGVTLIDKNISLPKMASLEECHRYQGHVNILAEEVAYEHVIGQRRYLDLPEPQEEEGLACPTPTETVLCYFGTTGIKKDDWSLDDCVTARAVYAKCTTKGVVSDTACISRALVSVDSE